MVIQHTPAKGILFYLYGNHAIDKQNAGKNFTLRFLNFTIFCSNFCNQEVSKFLPKINVHTFEPLSVITLYTPARK